MSEGSPPADQAGQPPEAPVPQNVHVIELPGKRIHLIGTAHISAQSVEEVRRVIAEVKPVSVCVELCESRYQSLTRPEAWREMNVVQVVRQKRATMLLVHLILAAFQRRMGDRLGIRPGAEMLAAIEATEEAGAELVLADRAVQVTLIRTWRKLRWLDKWKMAAQLGLLVVASPRLDAKEVEALKNQDVLSQVMDSFSAAFPRAKVTLIDERDRFLAEKIRTAPGGEVVAVVGAGHVKGIRTLLEAGAGPEDLAPLLEIPRRGRLLTLLKWAVPALVVGLLGYGFFAADAQVSLQMVQIWVLANGSLAALGALLALAHPLTVVAAFVAAPITSLNPMVAAGWVAGLCEAVLHKPRVRDFETLPADIVTVRGFWRNGVTRILLVVAFANLGSTIGTLVGIPLMSSLLG